MHDGGINLVVRGIESGDLSVAGQREVDGTLGLLLHLQKCMAEEMAQITGIIDRTGVARQRLHYLHIIQRLAAGILKEPHPLGGCGDFPAQEQDRRTVGGSRRDGGDRVTKARAADAKRRAEFAARPSIAISHVGSPSLLGSHNRADERLPPQRRQKRINQTAGHHKKMVDFLRGQRIKNKVSAKHGCLYTRSPYGGQWYRIPENKSTRRCGLLL